MRRLLPDTQGTWWFVALILTYCAAALWITIALPAHATPNELLNFEYIQVMRQIRGLPNRGLVDSEVRYTEWHQPPLYFAFAALAGWGVPVPPADTNPPPPIIWPENPSFVSTHRGNLNPVIHITPHNTPLLYVGRIAAMLMGVLGLAALYRAGRIVYSAAIALLMISLLAFQPNFLHLSASVNNDMPLTAVSAAVLAYAILIIVKDKTPPWFFGLGLLAAATLLTKASGIFAASYLAVTWLVVFMRHRDWSRTFKSAAYSLAGLLPLWIAWLALNTIRMKDTLGVEGSLPVDRVLKLSPGAYTLLIPWLDDIWRSFWLDWSTGGIGYAPDWFYLLWVLFLVIALVGWIKRPPQRSAWSVLLAVLAGVLAISYLYFAVKALTVKEAGWMVPEGRWWLPVMPGAAWLAAAGFSRWWSPARRDSAALLAALIPVLSTCLLLWLFFPALYPRAAPLAPAADAAREHAIVFDDQFALLEAGADPFVTGRAGEVTFTWQALADLTADYKVTAELHVPEKGGWIKIEEQKSIPGLGLTPTKGWQNGETYRDTWLLKPTGELNGPVLANLVVQVRHDGRRLPAVGGGAEVNPAIALTVAVRPPEPLAPASLLAEPVQFGERFQLVGAHVDVEQSDMLVTLWWQALQPGEQDYTVFLHMLDEKGTLIAQDDSPPARGASPTSIWQEGDVIRDVHRLPNAGDATALLIGLYDPFNGARLPAAAGGQVLPDHAYRYSLTP